MLPAVGGSQIVMAAVPGKLAATVRVGQDPPLSSQHTPTGQSRFTPASPPRSYAGQQRPDRGFGQTRHMSTIRQPGRNTFREVRNANPCGTRFVNHSTIPIST
jgi:hypothetical protein